MVTCCGKVLSRTGEKIISYGWLTLNGTLLIIGIIMCSINPPQPEETVYVVGVLITLMSVISLMFWACYVCNVWGMQDPGCFKNCCSAYGPCSCLNCGSSYGEL